LFYSGHSIAKEESIKAIFQMSQFYGGEGQPGKREGHTTTKHAEACDRALKLAIWMVEKKK
jgi:hypothetical protein